MSFIDKVVKALKDGTIKAKDGGFTHVTVKHDDDCSFFLGGDCDCDPDIGNTKFDA